jgi:enamidase
VNPEVQTGDGDLVIHGAGTIVSGKLDAPIQVGDAILCRDGLIAAIGSLDDVHPGGDPRMVDAAGATLVPGLIDPHVHPVLGDYTPRQNTLGWIDSYVHGGVTSFVSAGEPHAPGRPRTPAGVKALAILAHQAFQHIRPAGAKVHAGAVLLEPGLVESDFAELAEAGVWLMGEIGISGVHRPEEAKPLVDAARRYGFHVPVHVGGASVPGSSVIGAETVIALKPDVAAHCNGGPTAASHDDILRIIHETDAAIEVVQAGNIRALQAIVQELVRLDLVHRLQIGTDTPSGTGVVPLGMLRTIAYCCALGELAPEVALATASGQTAARYQLKTGILAPGHEADVVILDAPRGSTANTALDALAHGDTPAVAAVAIDGVVRVYPSRNTPPAVRSVSVPWLQAATH